jgi:hypothetical protein
VPVYWRNFVREVLNAWKSPDDMSIDEPAEKLE